MADNRVLPCNGRDRLEHIRNFGLHHVFTQKGEAVVLMYRKGKELRDMFRVSERTYSKVRKVIADNPERYGVYGTLGIVTDDRAFADALKYHKSFECGLSVPPFNPEDLARVLETRSA